MDIPTSGGETIFLECRPSNLQISPAADFSESLEKNAFRRRGAHNTSDKAKMSAAQNDFARVARWKLRSPSDPRAIRSGHAQLLCQGWLGRWPRPASRTSSRKVLIFIVIIVISEQQSSKNLPPPRWLIFTPRPRGWNLFMRGFPKQRVSPQRGATFSGAPIDLC